VSEQGSTPSLRRNSARIPGSYVPHVAVNRSTRTPAVFVTVRNEPTAQESVVMRADLDERVP
jgi:uncharacterized RmlC-like cupin family protein